MPYQYGWGDALSQWGAALSQWGEARERREIDKIKFRYGDNIDAWRQDALKDPNSSVAKQYKRYVGDPNIPLPEDPKVAAARMQQENLAEYIKNQPPEIRNALTGLLLGVPGGVVEKQMGMIPKAPEPVSALEKAKYTAELGRQSASPWEIVQEAARSQLGEKSAKYSGLYGQSSPEVQSMIESGPYGDINKWSPGVPRLVTKNEAEAEEASRRIKIQEDAEKRRVETLNQRKKEFGERIDIAKKTLNNVTRNINSIINKRQTTGVGSSDSAARLDRNSQVSIINSRASVIRTQLANAQKRMGDALDETQINSINQEIAGYTAELQNLDDQLKELQTAQKNPDVSPVVAPATTPTPAPTQKAGWGSMMKQGAK